MADRPFAESAERNGVPILAVLLEEFAHCTRVLEIGSGTGQHAARFAAAMRHLQWQTSDLDENHSGLMSCVDDAGVENLLPPLTVDVRAADLPAQSFDAVYSSNTAHIMSFATVEKMFAVVGGVLTEDGVFCLYGPFRIAGEFNTTSNAAFHQSLRARNPEMGIRHLENLDELAVEHGLAHTRLYAMPANNQLVVWRKGRP